MKRRELIQHATAQLEVKGVENPRRHAEWMLEEVLGCTRAALLSAMSDPVPEEAREKLDGMIARRLAGEPLQYILGHTEFFGLRIEVTPDVLIPRPETEQVVEEALRLLASSKAPHPRVLDIGTGSGCIALAIRHAFPQARVHACDTSTAALSVASRNAESLALPVHFHLFDVLSGALSAGTFDLVVSNPPYIPKWEKQEMQPEVLHHEPGQALFVGDDPMRFYRAITRQAGALLNDGGRLVFETHEEYAGQVASLLEAAGFAEVTVRKDLAGKDRIASARWSGK